MVQKWCEKYILNVHWIINNSPNTSFCLGLDVRVPPTDQTPAQAPRGRGRPLRGQSPKMAAQFNVSSGTNFGSVTSTQTTVTQQVNSAVEGLLTINPAMFGSTVLQTTTATSVQGQMMTTQTSMAQNVVTTQATAMELFSSMQEGDSANTTVPNDVMSEEDRAVQQLLAQMPGPPGPAVQTVENPSSVIELNSAGNWELDGVEVSKEFADELSTVAAQYMQTTKSGDLDKVDLTQLQDANMGEILISAPNSPENAEMMVEDGVHDSVTLPFSRSIELGASPSMLSTSEANQ